MSTNDTALAGGIDRDVTSVGPPKRRLTVVSISLMLVCSVGLNVLLARKIKQVTGVQSASIVERQLKVGTKVPGFQGVDLKGQPQKIAYDQGAGKATVLYVFTPPCHWCERNLDNLKELLSRK